MGKKRGKFGVLLDGLLLKAQGADVDFKKGGA
jgi:hypothetical protein